MKTEAITQELGEFQIRKTDGGATYLRFGYWKRVDVKRLQELVGSPVQEDDLYDDDCGWLYSYYIS
jgi:hypothetical protein